MKLWHTLFLFICVLLIADALVGDADKAARLNGAGQEAVKVVGKVKDKDSVEARDAPRLASRTAQSAPGFAAWLAEDDTMPDAGIEDAAVLVPPYRPAISAAAESAVAAAAKRAAPALTMAGARVSRPDPQLIEG